MLLLVSAAQLPFTILSFITPLKRNLFYLSPIYITIAPIAALMISYLLTNNLVACSNLTRITTAFLVILAYITPLFSSSVRQPLTAYLTTTLSSLVPLNYRKIRVSFLLPTFANVLLAAFFSSN